MSRNLLCFPLFLVLVLPWTATAQTNAPLTSGGAIQSAASAATVPASQVMPERAVVRQVQTPMPAAPAATTSAVATADAPAAATERREEMGDVTRGLLAAQADGRRAGGALPILGPVSSASWNRYLDSFRQPIPQWFTERVETDAK